MLVDKDKGGGSLSNRVIAKGKFHLVRIGCFVLGYSLVPRKNPLALWLTKL